MQESPPSEVHRVQGLWFPDADLILRADDTLFRVYSSILSARSAVFADMAAFPQPAHPEGLSIDGHPIVLLHDLAAEVEVFLRAIFDSSFFMPPPSATDFATIIGVMRLAHKYDVQYLFRRALSHLDSLYPMPFLDFLEVNVGVVNHHIDYPAGIDTDLIALRAASEVGALWLLPGVYYSICVYSSAEMFASAHWAALGAQQQRTCLASQVVLLRATAATHDVLLELPDDEMCAGEECADALHEARVIVAGWTKTGRDVDPLRPWAFAETESALCLDCTRYGEQRYTAAQETFWDRLPDLLGLPAWVTLSEMRGNALMAE
ncbi:hypothetical protein C8R43DRAFT_976046 [Mycena crocata]|nr:hypothetical protein C8R43DRAFT_976046 [Mycena crocata]